MILREQLSGGLTSHGLDLDDASFEALWAYVQLLIKWNRRINLTGFSFEGDTSAAVERLLLEPLAAARVAKTARRVLDVGSGGGSPAIPFFLGLDQASELVLVESRTKKAVFLREALRATGISGRVVVDRFEQMEEPDTFDVVTVRAVAADAQLWALINRTLSAGGRLYWFHSVAQHQPEQEVVAWSDPVCLLDGTSLVSVGTRFA